MKIWQSCVDPHRDYVNVYCSLDLLQWQGPSPSLWEKATAHWRTVSETSSPGRSPQHTGDLSRDPQGAQSCYWLHLREAGGRPRQVEGLHKQVVVGVPQRRTWSFISLLIQTSLQNKSWNMFHLMQWRKSDGMIVCMLLYKNASLNLKNEFQLENWNGASLVTQLVKNPPAMQETPLWFLGQEVPLEKGQATHPVFLGFPSDSAGRESTCSAGDLGLIPGLGRSPGEGNGYPLQYSGLEISMDYIVDGVAKSWTQLSDFHFHFQSETRGKHIISRWPRCCLFESELGNLFLSDFLMSPQKGLLPLWICVSGGDTWGQTPGVPSSLPCAQTLRCIFLHHWAPSALLSLWFKWVSPGAASSALSFMWKEPLPGNLLISLLMSWMQCVNPFSHQLLSNFHA